MQRTHDPGPPVPRRAAWGAALLLGAWCLAAGAAAAQEAGGGGAGAGAAAEAVPAEAAAAPAAEATPAPAAAEGEKTAVTLEAKAAPAAAAAGKKRFYKVTGIAEFYLNVVSDDYTWSDFYAVYYLRGDFDVTKNNRVSLRLDLTQKFVADEGESGLWFGDMRLSYTRSFLVKTAFKGYTFPAKLDFYVTLPTARASYQRGIVTKPALVGTMAPVFGPVTLTGRLFMTYVFARYAQSKMGDPNPQFNIGYELAIAYQPLPWLVLSADWQYTWKKLYRSREGSSQLWNADYYWEVGPTFIPPLPKKGPALELSLLYSQGSRAIEDGVYRLYFVKRDQSQVYLSLNLNY